MANQVITDHSGPGDHLLALAALFKDPFSIDWLLDMTQAKASEVLSILEAGINDGLIKRIDSSRFCFLNADARENLLKTLGAQERDFMHGKAAKLLDRELPEGDAKTEYIAHHCLNTSNDIEGCRWLVRAGDLYLAKLGIHKAKKYYFKAIRDALTVKSDEADRLLLEMVLKIIKFEELEMMPYSFMHVLTQAKNIAAKIENSSLVNLLDTYITKTEFARGIYEKSGQQGEKGSAIPLNKEEIQDKDTYDLYYLLGYFRDIAKHCEESILQWPIDKNEKISWSLLARSASGYAFTGKYAEGMDYLNRIYEYARRTGNQFAEGTVAFWIGNVLTMYGHYEDAIPYLKVSLAKSKGTYTIIYECSPLLLAYTYYKKNDIGKSVFYMEQYYKQCQLFHGDFTATPPAMEFGWAHEENKYPYVKGLLLKENLDRHLQSPHLIIRGYAHFYKALFQRKNQQPVEDVLNSLNRSLSLLEQAGFLPGIMNTKMMLIQMFLVMGEQERAQKVKKSIVKYFSIFSEEIIPADLKGFFADLTSSENLLNEILRLSKECTTVADKKTLMSRILSVSNRFAGADRGAIFLPNEEEERDEEPALIAATHMNAQAVSQPGFQESMEMIKETIRMNRQQIMIAEDPDGGPDRQRSGKDVRICMPMVVGNRTVGVLYHDNFRSINGLNDTNLAAVSYFAAQAAIALDHATIHREFIQLKHQIEEERHYYEEHLSEKPHYGGIIGESAGIKQMLVRIDQVAATNATVLILGETGVGKELVAKALHAKSLRADKPFVYVDCSTIPESLLPGELFGYEKGAFTGAVSRRIGRFQLADGGTLFLDEIGDLTPEVQLKLLRVFQTKTFDMLGGHESLHSDFRLILATHRNLAEEVNTNKFRQDLFYRINVFPIHVPSLRERKSDIPLLAYHFLKIYSMKLGRSINAIAKRDMDRLLRYDWPGNVRELENVIERNVILSHGSHLRLTEFAGDAPKAAEPKETMTLIENERRCILQALEMTGGKIHGSGGTAELLAINPYTLRSRMKKLGIKKPLKYAAKKGDPTENWDRPQVQ